ncbi:MAG: class I SAM-dependent methyltransferase [Candidatus Cohnella colombiensis]|uniref:Class I SAM-dependent methyltransferase n=1 Tax=Candidatus Cohnella colombiensis TaxID=3121368 RepID=A0AA95EUJ7_9BACL|nr:MAG: class I SAM-dependent methyltransferase [Cohnella sp.]
MSTNAKPPEYPQIGVASTCRSYEEYEAMFSLKEVDWSNQIVLDVAGGASSFTAQVIAKGARANAVDPFFAGLTEHVIEAARREIDVSSGKIAANADAYDWSFYGSPERHRSIRLQSLERFAEDFRQDLARERYVAASLPHLPFADNQFSFIVCSHFLFLYADQFGEEFHENALRELLRVLAPGGQLRIYPLVTLKWEYCEFIPNLIERLEGIAKFDFFPTKLPFMPIPSQVLQVVKLAN